MPDPGSAGAPSRVDSTVAPDPGTLAADALEGEATLDPQPAPDAGFDPAQSAQQAQAVLRHYYNAVSGGDHAGAYALWADQGRASGQSLQQFAEGFASSEGVSVQLGESRAIAGSGGALHVEIPVTVDGRQSDGVVRRHAGTYTLRLDTIDASSRAQRWSIVSADLREIRP